MFGARAPLRVLSFFAHGHGPRRSWYQVRIFLQLSVTDTSENRGESIFDFLEAKIVGHFSRSLADLYATETFMQTLD
ncbi:hypothetical protein MRB53_020098 [Persea americana]|uniref:Uncharacterized protein n=1 Tax=Persea americana TaxID=3435 RepID=A0ACC2L074_PERAE|nr:hypothetical protein MRB53_020098 [Persea americana]